jgi:chloride channel protein, CIC family
MTSVLIIIEMTRGYSLILPLMIANMTAYVLARRFRPASIYEALLEQDGIRLRHPADAIQPGPVLSFVSGAQPVALTPEMPAVEVLLRCGHSNGRHVYPVVGADRVLLGIVTQEQLGMLESNPELVAVTTAFDLMLPPVFVRADDDLAQVIDKMLTSGLRELPITDNGGHLLGCIDDQTMASAYQRKSLI